MNGIPFRIDKIIIADFFIKEKLVIPDNATFGIETGFAFGVDRNNHTIKCDSSYKFTLESEKFLYVSIFSFFEIEEEAFKDFYNSKNDFVISKDFLRHMATICVGTARGVLITKTENTSMANIILPPLNLVEAIKDDFIIPSESLNEESVKN